MKKKIILGIMVMGLLGTSVGLHMTGHLWTSGKSKSLVGKAEIVIDPGHGGEDPGKVGINGVLEKDVNLAVAKMVKKQLKKEKIKVVLTRTSDDIEKDGNTYRKMTDLNHRLDIIEEANPKLVVGIHQNSFTSEEVHGAQVFYDEKSEEAGAAAAIMQKCMLDFDPNNKRVAKSDQNYYLLAKSTAPTIIVECGFLSNKEEADLLGQKSYQTQVSRAIVKGILQYLNPVGEE